jgi:hypothetical protein
MIADKYQTTQDQDVITMLSGVAKAPDNGWIRPSVTKGKDATHFDGSTGPFNFFFRLRLFDKVSVVVFIFQSGQEIRSLGLWGITCQTVPAPGTARIH